MPKTISWPKTIFWIVNRPLIQLALIGFILLHADAAQAQALFDSGTNFLDALQNLLTSTWARTIAIIAVVFLGFAWMFGRISMQLAIAVIGGVILVFGAPPAPRPERPDRTPLPVDQTPLIVGDLFIALSHRNTFLQCCTSFVNLDLPAGGRNTAA